MDAQLIDQIYESGFVPELWPRVLTELTRVAAAKLAFLHVSAGEAYQTACSNPNWYEQHSDQFKNAVGLNTRRARLLLSCEHSGFLREIDFLSRPNWREKLCEAGFTTPAELSAEHMTSELFVQIAKVDPFYREVMFPEGLGWVAATTFDLPTTDRIFVSVERELSQGPVENRAIEGLDEIRPHLARAAMMTARFQREQAAATANALAGVGFPALVLNGKGRVLAANHLIQNSSGLVNWHARDRFSLKDRAADKIFQEALTTIDHVAASARSFPVRNSDCETTMVAHLAPIRRSARDIFVHCTVALVFTPTTLPDAPPVELVQSLFDLTPAEARIARNLAAGQTVDEIASTNGISTSTVRTHVHHLLEKTGSTRQADVVSLLTRIGATTIRPIGRADGPNNIGF